LNPDRYPDRYQNPIDGHQGWKKIMIFLKQKNQIFLFKSDLFDFSPKIVFLRFWPPGLEKIMIFKIKKSDFLFFFK